MARRSEMPDDIARMGKTKVVEEMNAIDRERKQLSKRGQALTARLKYLNERLAIIAREEVEQPLLPAETAVEAG